VDLKLAGRVALVTGGSKGIGRACALALAREGCDIAIVARTVADLRQAQAEIELYGTRCVIIPADCSEASGIQRMVASMVEHYGHIDILVNCAGGAAAGGLFAVTDAEWQEAFELKVLGYLRATRAVAAIMQQQGEGRIIMISGTAGRQPSPYSMCIGALNAAINNFTRSIADELAPHGIGVVAVSPGATETRRWDALQAATADLKNLSLDEARETLVNAVPLGRIAQPEEVGNLVAYLASPLATYLTGVNVVLDGGAVKCV
jgi:NAD(P)-dependent dehydrogenase (short-subunit alcohol dehydrogenase family)